MPTLAPDRKATWLLRLGALTAVATSIAFDLSALLVLPLLFALVVPFEKLFPRHQGQRVRRPLAGLDIRYALSTSLFSVASIAVGVIIAVVSLAWVPALALRPLVSLLPGWATPFVGVALFDLAIYWAHRWSHEVPALWRFHAIHHSTQHLDWVSGFRAHPLDGAIVAPPVVFLLVAGFDPTFTGVLAVVQFLTGLFLHANVRWRWRPLHRVVITPEFHHWHHANESEAYFSNYSVFLPLWDLAFGTYYLPTNRRPMRYGVSMPIPDTMLGQLAVPFRGWPTPWQLCRHPIVGLRLGASAMRRLLADVARSTTRPRTAYPRPGEPFAWALTAPCAPATGQGTAPLPACVSGN